MAEKETVISEHAFIQSQIIPVNYILARVLARLSVHQDVDGQNRYASFNGVLKAYTDLGLLGKNDYGTHLKVAKFLSVNLELLTLPLVPCCDTNIKSVIKNTLLKQALDCYDHDYSCKNRFHFLYQDGDSKSKKRSLRHLINLLDQHGKKEGIAKFRLYRRNRKKDQRKRRKSSQQSHEPSHGEYCAGYVLSFCLFVCANMSYSLSYCLPLLVPKTSIIEPEIDAWRVEFVSNVVASAPVVAKAKTPVVATCLPVEAESPVVAVVKETAHVVTTVKEMAPVVAVAVARETAHVVTTVKTPVEALDLDEDSVFGDGEVFQ